MGLFDLVIVQPIFNLLMLIYSVVPGADFGVALIILTVVIRFLMWPLTKKQLHQSKAMRKMQPELQRIKKQAKGNKQIEGMQMMELYKKHNISPFSSIFVLLVQFPIFIALFSVIRIFTDGREKIAQYTYDFLQNIPIINQIIEHPETFNEKLFGFIDLTQHAVSTNGVSFTLIILAFIGAGTQYVLSKQLQPQNGTKKRLRDVLSEAETGKQPDQAEVNAIMMSKMSKFFPVMMFFIMIGLPAALALYYAVSNMVAAGQQYYILKKDESEMELIASEKLSSKNKAKPKPTKAQIVTKKSKKRRDTINRDSQTKVTRIKATDNKRKK